MKGSLWTGCCQRTISRCEAALRLSQTLRGWLAAVLLIPVIGPQRSWGQYLITDVGTFGGSFSSADGISAAGVVVGLASLPGDATWRTYRLDAGVMQDLGLPASSSVSKIDDTGGIIGTLWGRYGERSSFLVRGGTMVTVPITELRGVNAAGTVVGASPFGGLSQHAYSYADGNTIDLGTFGGGFARAHGINDLGQIVGQSSNSAGEVRAFLYEAGVMQDIGDLGGGYASASAINNSGQVTGQSTTPGGAVVPFLYKAGAMFELPPVEGLPGSYDPTSINGHGVVVGSSHTLGAGQLAWIHIDGVTRDLNSLIPAESGWRLVGASDINDAGQIVGSGYLNGDLRGYVLTLIPEPESWALAAGALLCAACLLRHAPGCPAGGWACGMKGSRRGLVTPTVAEPPGRNRKEPARRGGRQTLD